MKERTVFQVCTIIFLITGSFYMSGCAQQIPTRAEITSAPSEGQPIAWIDAPLNESHHPLAPYEIVFHITGTTSLSLGELVINDQVAALLLVDDASKKLATLKYMWVPDQPGKYIIHTRPQISDGEWGEAASAVVYIDPADETETPIPTPTHTPSPEPENLAGISDIQKEPNPVNYGSCQPNQLTISAYAQDPAGINVLSIFYRLSDASGNLTGWLNEAMNPTGNGNFQKTVNITSAAEKLGFNSQTGTFIYQLIIQNNNGDMVRSDVFRDVSIVKCAEFNIPKLNTVVPVTPLMLRTPTVIIIK